MERWRDSVTYSCGCTDKDKCPGLLTTQVDNRLAGEGTGRILGFDSGIEAFVFLAVFTAVWAVFYNSQRDLDAGRDTGDDSGLSL